MLRRHCTSIAEEPDVEKNSARGVESAGKPL